MNEELVRKTQEIYKETKNVVRINDEESECFWTQKGVIQGCPLSPILFTIYISEIDEVFRKAQTGGVVVGSEKVWTLAYADDLVILANEEKRMKKMIKNAERYMERKRLEVKVEKTKMMVFRK